MIAPPTFESGRAAHSKDRVRGALDDPASEFACGPFDIPPCYATFTLSGASNGNPLDMVAVATPVSLDPTIPLGAHGLSGIVPSLLLPNAGSANGAGDMIVSIAFPLLLDRPIRFGAALIAETPSDAEVQLAQVTVASLELPSGVQVSSAADALDAYSVPEPRAGGAAAVLALATLRRSTRSRQRVRAH